MLDQPASSLTRRTLLLIAAAVSGLIAVTSYVTYRLVFDAVEDRGRVSLGEYVAERSKREEARFVQVRENLQLVETTFRDRYRQAPEIDYRARWEAVVHRDADGAWRSRKDRVDGTKESTVWAHRDVVLTPELLRRTIVLYDLLDSFRPVWIGSFRSLWGATPEMTNIGFDPLIPNWVYNTPPDWAQNDVEYLANAGPARNPERKLTWTFQTQDVPGGYFYTFCLPVYEGDRLLVTFGHDVHVPKLFEESLKSEVTGTAHMMFARDGRVIAHPEKQKEILSSLGKYSMNDDPKLRSLYEQCVAQNGPAISGYDPVTGLYFVARRLREPDWYFMATLPRALLQQQAFHYAQWVLWVGFASLALILGCLALILRRTVTHPLRRLIDATERLGAGEPNYRLPIDSDDEIGRLSSAFNRMASNVAERDQQLRQLNQNLERRIEERTAELQVSEAQVRAVIEHAPEAIVVVDVDRWRYEQANGNALHFFDTNLDTLRQTGPGVISPPVQPDGRESIPAAKEYARAALSGAPVVFDWLIRRRNGTEVPCEIRMSRLPAEGRNLIVSTITDITERKQAEASLIAALARERELGEMKSGFVSMVSHEFRTPLGVILSSTEILQHYFDRLPPEKRNDHLRTIVRSVRSLSRLVEEVLLLGRVEAGRLKFVPAPLDLSPLCDQLVDEAKSSSDAQHPISLELDADLAHAVGDENLLRHIVGNLLSNAAKYSPAGSPITFTVRRADEFAVFTITDRGIGIPEEDRKHLFQAFRRGRNVGQRPGSGLGLAIVRSFVQQHAGEIDLDSEVGMGTTVTVRLPLFGRFTPVSRHRFPETSTSVTESPE